MPNGETARNGSTLTLVVPCYNEAKRLDVEAFSRYAAANPDVGFLFVDDGSTDDTSGVLADLVDRNPVQFQLKALPGNVGKAAAVRAGVLDALEQPAPVVGYWDADLATPLDELEGMRRILFERPGVHIVTGARVNLLGRAVRRNLIRHWLGRVFATIASAVLRLPIYDTQCGAKLFRVQSWTSGLFADSFETSWVFDVEILARLVSEPIVSVAGDPRSIICEYPLAAWSETPGSKLRAHDAVGAVIDLAKIYRRYLRHRRA
jgi:glycosyltransferase involved in cell wall biosynthesis